MIASGDTSVSPERTPPVVSAMGEGDRRVRMVLLGGDLQDSIAKDTATFAAVLAYFGNECLKLKRESLILD